MQREAAMTGQILEAQRDVSELVLRNKDRWLGDFQRHLGDKAAAYRLAVVALEEARADLVEDVQVGAWLAMFPQNGGQPQAAYMPEKRLIDPLTGRQERVALPQRTFTDIRDDLLRDSEVLPAAGPVQPTTEYLRTLDRKQLVVQSVDAEGNVRPQVLQGDTREGWAGTRLHRPRVEEVKGDSMANPKRSQLPIKPLPSSPPPSWLRQVQVAIRPRPVGK
jgi:hypothetical protein